MSVKPESGLLVGWVLCGVVRSSEALSPEHAVMTFDNTPPPPAIALQRVPLASLSMLPANFEAPPPAMTPAFSDRDFRPRQPNPLDRSAHIEETPMLRGTTVWQRLKDFRSGKDHVRLLTLWESGTGTVSLQAGKRGDASLQWTSRWLNRGGATRGLLDGLVALSVAGIGNGLRGGSNLNGLPAVRGTETTSSLTAVRAHVTRPAVAPAPSAEP